jgi:hypothetical protein
MRTTSLLLGLSLFTLLACGGDEITYSPAAGAGGAAAGAAGSSAGSSGAAQAGDAGSAGQAGSGGSSGTSGQAGSSGTSGQAGSSGSAGQGGCSASEAPPENALLVAPDGSDSEGDGSPAAPFATLSWALLASADSDKPKLIILAEGTYDGRIVAPFIAGPITIEGGWVRKNGAWQRDCEADASRTILTSEKHTPVLQMLDLTHDVSLRLLTVKTKDQGLSEKDKPGESLIGVYLSSIEQINVLLEQVAIVAGKGGEGGPASVGENADNKCNGVSDCSDGKDGENGKDGDPQLEASSFNANGYVPSNGNPGTSGSHGANGTMGGDAKNIVCSKCTGEKEDTCPNTLTSYTESSKPGVCGCGGKLGEGGKAGQAGGASVGLLVVGPIEMYINKTTVKSSDGGGASPGASGAEGQQGGVGIAGIQSAKCQLFSNEATCVWSSASEQCLVSNATFSQAPGGTAGGMGGKGGKGGKGSGGAGGPSIAVVQVAGAKVKVDVSSSLKHGKGGPGAEGAPDGTAAKFKGYP